MARAMAKAGTQKERETLKQPVTLGDQIFERKREVEPPAAVSPKSKIKASPPSEKAKSKAASKPRTSRASGSNDLLIMMNRRDTFIYKIWAKRLTLIGKTLKQH